MLKILTRKWLDKPPFRWKVQGIRGGGAGVPRLQYGRQGNISNIYSCKEKKLGCWGGCIRNTSRPGNDFMTCTGNYSYGIWVGNRLWPVMHRGTLGRGWFQHRGISPWHEEGLGRVSSNEQSSPDHVDLPIDFIPHGHGLNWSNSRTAVSRMSTS